MGRTRLHSAAGLRQPRHSLHNETQTVASCSSTPGTSGRKGLRSSLMHGLARPTCSLCGTSASAELDRLEPWTDGDAGRTSALPSADIRHRRGQERFQLVTQGEVRLGSPCSNEEITADQHEERAKHRRDAESNRTHPRSLELYGQAEAIQPEAVPDLVDPDHDA